MTDATRTAPSLLDLLTLNPARDVEGRALLESAADAEALAEVEKSYETCRYEDSPSRLGHAKPMNTAALEQAKRHFAEMLALLRFLRNLHLESVGGTELVAADWRRICMSGEMLPRFLFLRRRALAGATEDYYSWAVPTDVSTLFKTVRGVAKVFDYLQRNPDEVAARAPKELAARLELPRPKAAPKKGKAGGRGGAAKKPLTAEQKKRFRAARWTVDDLLWVAERFDLFVGETEVCAAPTNMVRATLAALLDGKNPHDELDLTDELKELIGPGAGFVRFCEVLDAYYLELRRFRERSMQATERLKAELAPLSPGQHGRALAIAMEGLDGYLVFERRFLEHSRAVQAELLEAAGCTAEAPRLDLEFLDALVPENRRAFARIHFRVRVEHGEGEITVSLQGEHETVTESVPYAPE